MLEIGISVEDYNEYVEIRSRSAVVFDLDARLPGLVFNNIAGDSLFCEFDALLAPELWPALSAMARWHGDRHVELLVLEPDCEEFYFQEYQVYPAVSLDVDASVGDYWAAIGHESYGDIMGSIAISANVVALTGTSGKWGCWGERGSELAVFRGFPSMLVQSQWRAQFGPFLDVSGALESYLPLAFSSRTVPDEYAATLTANYAPSP